MQKFSGINYLRIAMANHFGLDKSQFGGRLKWVNDNETKLESFVNKAKEPFQYAAALMAYRKTQKGLPTGYLVEMDACASGVQIMSTLMGCKIGAANTGLIGTTRKNIYNKATEIMNKILSKSNKYDEASVKIAAMTHFYGSKAEPKNTFGIDTPELGAFYEALKIVAPGAEILMHYMIKAWQPNTLSHDCIMPDGFSFIKKVQQTIDTKIEVDELEGHPSFMYRHTINKGTETGISLAADLVHANDGFVVREMNYRCNYNKLKLKRAERMLNWRLMHGSYTAIGSITSLEKLAIRHNFVSLVHAEKLTLEEVNSYSYKYAYDLLKLIRHTLTKHSFPIIFIHDAFKAHANNINYVRQTYIDIFAEIADSNIINTIFSMITGKDTIIKKLSDDLGDEIRNSNYSLS